MRTENRDDAILVKIIEVNDDGEEKIVSSYYTPAIDQTLKSFITTRNNNIECCFNQYSSVVDKSYLQSTYFIKDIYMNFASSEDIPVIEVFI